MPPSRFVRRLTCLIRSPSCPHWPAPRWPRISACRNARLSREDGLRGAVNPEILQKTGCLFRHADLKDGALRGCIGSLEACRPLLDDLRSNALAAALRDPRFPPLTAAELPDVDIEVSVLGTPQALVFPAKPRPWRSCTPASTA